MMKLCPREGLELTARDVGGIAVAQCSTCSGIWIPGRVVSNAIGPVSSTSRLSPTGSPRQCPDDQSRLTVLHHHSVEIDRCETCGGVWLDHGELERIVRQKRAIVLQKPPPPKRNRSNRGAMTEIAGEAVVDLTGEAIGLVFEFLGDALSGL